MLLERVYHLFQLGMGIRVECLCKSIFKSTQKFLNLKFIYFSTIPRKAPIQFSPERHHRSLISLSSLFQRYGFLPTQLPGFLKKNQFLLNLKPQDIETSFKILLSLKPSQEFLSSVVYNCPSVLQLEFLKKWELEFTKIELPGMTSVAIQNILQVSKKYNLSSCDFSRCIMCMKGLGFSDNTVINIFEAFPMVVMMNEDSIRYKMKFLVDIGMENRDLDRICTLFPNFIGLEVRTRLKPLFDEFKDLGFNLDVVRKEILRDPMVLGLEVGELSQCLEMLRSLKCRFPIIDSIFRDGVFRAGFEVKMKVDCLRRHGLTYRDAFTVLWKEPRIILYEIEDIEKKIEFLVHTMNFNVLCLVQVPEYLGVNFEKKIVPRFSVIEYLRSRDGLGDDIGLRDLIKPSRLRFYNLYVKPYPECEEMYGRFARDTKTKRGHPVGMWKLFKPQKHPHSAEEIKNIKLVMKSLS